ncbi:hypothetical protein DXG03_006426, partial [Asterophora parasitica]
MPRTGPLLCRASLSLHKAFIFRRNLGALAQHTRPSRRQSQTFPSPVTRDEPASAVKKRIDPHALVASELSSLRSSLLGLLGSAHPGLSEIARYYFLQPSQQLRSLIVLLFSHATNGLGRHWAEKAWAAQNEVDSGLKEELDRPLRLPDVLNNWHPSMPNHTASFASVFELRPAGLHTPPSSPPSSISADANPNRIPRLANPHRLLHVQLRLAQITEMIHIASVLHDGVDDATAPSATTSTPSPPEDGGFGNKLSILGGDFLLGRASAALSRLGESEVVELVGGVISNLAEGEMLRVQGRNESPERTTTDINDAWDLYLRRTYLKTASLMAKSARAAVVLGGCREGEIWKDVAYAYGRNLGIAYQLVEDTMEYESGGLPMLVTGPVLFAGEEHPELQTLIHRNLAGEGDIKRAVDFVSRSDGVERTRRLAQSYADAAREVLELLPDSDPKAALAALA